LAAFATASRSSRSPGACHPAPSAKPTGSPPLLRGDSAATAASRP
jgi:hypothetical protein